MNDDYDIPISINDTIISLSAQIEGLKKQIDELNKRFPFTYSEQIFDEQWVKTEQETTQKEIKLIKEQIEKNKTYVSLLEEWKPE